MKVLVLQSPTEAFLFNKYFNFGFFFDGFIVIWVAIFTAAISLWRIKAIGFQLYFSRRPTKSSSACEEKVDANVSHPSSSSWTPTLIESLDESSSYCSFASHVSNIVNDDGRVKGKFTLRYEDDGNGNVDLPLTGGWVDDVRTDNVDYSSHWDWEGMLVKRGDDPSWYRYQDLTAFDGSIVRLWDGVWRENLGCR